MHAFNASAPGQPARGGRAPAERLAPQPLRAPPNSSGAEGIANPYGNRASGPVEPPSTVAVSDSGPEGLPDPCADCRFRAGWNCHRPRPGRQRYRKDCRTRVSNRRFRAPLEPPSTAAVNDSRAEGIPGPCAESALPAPIAVGSVSGAVQIEKDQPLTGREAMISSHSSTPVQTAPGSAALRAMKPGTSSRPVGMAGSL